MISIKSDTRLFKIRIFDETIFSQKYSGKCMDCSYCEDICCSNGCQLDLKEKAKILLYEKELKERLPLPAEKWFLSNIVKDADFPSGAYIKSTVHNGKCIFYDHKNRGCILHRFAVKRNIDWHSIKPMVCILFPITWEGEGLYMSDFLNELPCSSTGISIYENQKEEIEYYFVFFLVKELETQSHVKLT
ncbi:MAG: DUF3109 family protein [Chloroflexi bacterium]|nr:DUF3109 family protein [Chloroflexota bacterium]